jgi:hypothetical protein
MNQPHPNLCNEFGIFDSLLKMFLNVAFKAKLKNRHSL